MDKTMISIEGLNKFYGSRQVLHDINLAVEEGECLGIIGKNGAGKTTLLECIENLHSWDSGRIAFKCCENMAHSADFLGVQLQSSSLPPEIKVYEVMELFAAEHGVTYDESSYKKLGIHYFLKKRYKQLSTGQKRRLHLFIAILHDPQIVILDEPTAGLDIEGKEQLYDVVTELKDKGKTILITSHDMTEIEKLCDRVVIVVDGRIVKIEQIHPQDDSDKDIVICVRTRNRNESRLKEIFMDGYQGSKNGYDEYHCRSISAFLNEYVQLILKNNDEIEDLYIKKSSVEDDLSDLIKGE